MIENAEGGLKLAVYEQLARVAHAMANGKRLHLLELLAQSERSVELLAHDAGLGMTSVSSHLQILRAAGLVQTRRAGTAVFYRLSGPDVAELFVTLKNVGLAQSPALRAVVGKYLSSDEDIGMVVPLIGRSSVVGADVVMLDVRLSHEYNAGHYPGAISIPLGELAGRISEVPAGRQVVVYCRGEFCKLAGDAARMLRAVGVDAAAMDEGVLEWRASSDVVLDATA